MGKVGECGLVLFRDGGDEGRKIVGEDEGWATTVRYSTLMSRRGPRIERLKWEEGTSALTCSGTS